MFAKRCNRYLQVFDGLSQSAAAHFIFYVSVM